MARRSTAWNVIREWNGSIVPLAPRQSLERRRVRSRKSCSSTSSWPLPASTRALRRRIPDADADRRHPRRAARIAASTPTRSTTAFPTATARAAYYGLLTLTPPGGDTRCLAFTSCARFSGRFRCQPLASRSAASRARHRRRCRSVAGETWPLEELMVDSPAIRRASLLADVAGRSPGLAHHPPLALRSRRRPRAGARGTASARASPRSRCSTTSTSSRRRLPCAEVRADRRRLPERDGRLARHRRSVRRQRPHGARTRSERRGFEPAIWVAPFVAEEQSERVPAASRLVHQGRRRRAAAIRSRHVRRLAARAVVRARRHASRGAGAFRAASSAPCARNGAAPTSSSTRTSGARCTAGGSTIRAPRASRPTAAACRRSSAARATRFILGCNHPIWPSTGLIHGSRSSNDIKRTWDRIATTARQNLSRNWQNGRLWWNDPDAVVLASDLTDTECQFHATAIYATGGMVLSGDDLTKLPPARAAMLRKLLPPTGVAAEFEDATLRVGHRDSCRPRAWCALFNWDDRPQTLSVRLPHRRPSPITGPTNRSDAGRASCRSRWRRVQRAPA